MGWICGALWPTRERPGKGLGKEDSRGPGAQGGSLLEGASLPFLSVASGSQPGLPALTALTWRLQRELFGIQRPLDPPDPKLVPHSHANTESLPVAPRRIRCCRKSTPSLPPGDRDSVSGVLSSLASWYPALGSGPTPSSPGKFPGGLGRVHSSCRPWSWPVAPSQSPHASNNPLDHDTRLASPCLCQRCFTHLSSLL